MLRQNSYPFQKILLELDKISSFTLSANAKPLLTNPLSKLQRTIFETLEIPIPTEPV